MDIVESISKRYVLCPQVRTFLNEIRVWNCVGTGIAAIDRILDRSFCIMIVKSPGIVQRCLAAGCPGEGSIKIRPPLYVVPDIIAIYPIKEYPEINIFIFHSTVAPIGNFGL